MMALNDNVDDVFLSYNNSLIRQGDLNLLRGPYWLNDTIIGFYFEYLEDKYQYELPEILFVCPELTQLLKVTASIEYSALLDPIEAKEKDWIFFPLNDCSSLERPGGTHWSLLIFSKPEKSCFHFDSSRGLNTSIAKDLSKNIMHYLLGNSDGNFIEIDCPQQENSYDCGLFVLCFAENVPIHIIKEFKIGFDSDFNQKLISDFRTVLLILMYKLKNHSITVPLRFLSKIRDAMVVMHRELHLEEHHIRYIESNYNSDGDSVGFVLGQSITNQDYIFQFVKAGSICTNAGGDLVTSFNHVSYHAILTAAKDVYSGLPSGMTVLGIFTNGPGFCKLDKENEMKYLKIIEAINEALTSAAPNLLGCGNPEFLVLNCKSCKNINCKSVDLRNKYPQEFSPVDVKIEKEPTKWYHMESAINLDYVIPLPYQDVREDTNLYLLNEFNNIMRSSIVLIDGELRPYFSKLKSIFKEDTFNETKYCPKKENEKKKNETDKNEKEKKKNETDKNEKEKKKNETDKNEKEKKKNETDKNENDVKNIQCEIYSSYDLGSNEIDEILKLDYLVQLRGRLFSRAVCHESLSIQDVVHYVKYDYLRTLLTRIQAYQCILRNCNVEQIYANTEKNIALHQLPRRILIQLPPYKIPISLYVYPNDQFYKSIDMTDILLRLYKPSELVEVDMEQIIDESELPWNQSQSKQNTVKAIHMDQCKQLIPSNQFILYTSCVIALIVLIFAILLHQLYSEK